jgi:exodeoxyribonuclease V beta subunit
MACIKAALIMDIMGVNGEQLISADQNSSWWELQLTHFQQYHRLWDQHGFIRMFQSLMETEHFKERLLEFADGERRLTNILHLAEILHQVSIDKNLGISGLLKWLAEQRDSSSPSLEEHQLRLESDEHAVKIVTVHKSKGLEYPVVFCPYAWEGSANRRGEVVYHDIDEDMQLSLDLGTDSLKRHTVLAQNESLAENLRLLYVALTRAKQRSYLVWGRINTAETSALAYLLHGSDITKGQNFSSNDILGSLKECVAAKAEAEMLVDLDALEQKSKGTIRVTALPGLSNRTYRPLQEQDENLVCRKFLGKIDHTWKISSYSSVVSSQHADVDLPDYDAYRTALGRSLDRRPDDSSIFSFPKGARAGIFFHDILEHIDYKAASQEDMQHLIARKLRAYGFDDIWQQTICEAITNVLTTPLPPESNFTLANIALTDRINEMEFYFPINLVTPQILQRVFTNEGKFEIAPNYPAKLGKLTFAPAAGFMKGFIDLVFQHEGKFYLVDWKSNYLGSTFESYADESLVKTMEDNLYILQYHLYTLALYQYLRRRIPDFSYDTDFGGVYYIFLRGTGVPQGLPNGIFSDCPAQSLINRLGQALIPDF